FWKMVAIGEYRATQSQSSAEQLRRPSTRAYRKRRALSRPGREKPRSMSMINLRNPLAAAVFCVLFTASASAQTNFWPTCTPIPAGTTQGTTVGASADGVSTCDPGSIPDVWYCYTPPCSGMVTVYTCNTTDWAPVISIHSGCPGTA